MIKFFLLLAAAWLALMPPFFTDGACTAEFDRESRRIDADSGKIGTPKAAADYWNRRDVWHTVLTHEQCRLTKPRFLHQCPSGTVVYGGVPVTNKICRFYRDSEVRFQLYYDDRGRLSRIATEMDPFKSLPVPVIGKMLHWAR